MAPRSSDTTASPSSPRRHQRQGTHYPHAWSQTWLEATTARGKNDLAVTHTHLLGHQATHDTVHLDRHADATPTDRKGDTRNTDTNHPSENNLPQGTTHNGTTDRQTPTAHAVMTRQHTENLPGKYTSTTTPSTAATGGSSSPANEDTRYTKKSDTRPSQHLPGATDTITTRQPGHTSHNATTHTNATTGSQSMISWKSHNIPAESRHVGAITNPGHRPDSHQHGHTRTCRDIAQATHGPDTPPAVNDANQHEDAAENKN